MLNENTPRSEAQQNASRINGSKSQGPTTPEGKARSSMNAMKHGLRSSIVVLANESQEKYDALLASYKRICQPVGQMEYDHLVAIVDTEWRLRRVRALATRALDLEMFQYYGEVNASFDSMDAPARQSEAVMSLTIQNPVLVHFDRHEERLQRIYNRALATLLKLQTVRLGAKPTFNFDDTNEPDTDHSNCEDEEIFAYFMRYTGKNPRHKPPAHDPNLTQPVVLNEQTPPQEEAA